MSNKVRLTNDSLNSYGYRVLTSGIDTTQFEKNPVLLWMHQRGNVIGYVKDLQRTDEEITGELVFDMASDLSVQCSKQWEAGSLRMVSVGLKVIETSGKTADLVEGQKYESVSKSELLELSLVDIGSNNDAIQLSNESALLRLSNMDCPPQLEEVLKQNKGNEMEVKTIALALGMPETANEEEVTAQLAAVKDLQTEVELLRSENESLREQHIVMLVDKAVSEKRLNVSKREQFIQLGKKLENDEFVEMLNSIEPVVKLSQAINPNSGDATQWKTLHDVPADKVVELKENNLEEYKRLYRAEYGIDL